MLRRMEEKGAVGSEDSGEVKMFYPLITREGAAHHETEQFLGRVYKGSIGMMLSAFTRKQNLTKSEIDELYSILNELEAKQND